MADTIRTEADLLANLFQDGQADGSITAQDMRDLIVSMKTINPELITGQSNPAYQEGLVFYDDEHKALSYYNENSQVTVNLGQEMVVGSVNNSGVAIADGDAVYVTGSVGERIQIAKAISSTNTPLIIGIATTSMANGENGYVTLTGVVHNYDTSSFSAGDLLYLSDSVAGGLTTTAPTLPNESYVVASVMEVAVSGKILVHPNRINRSNETTVYAQFISEVTQTAASINTAYSVALEGAEVKENITHSTSTNPEEITIAIAGAYQMNIGAQVLHDSGGGTSRIAMWLQEDTGGGFADIANSAVVIDLSSNDTDVLYLNHVDRWSAGDKVRIQWASTNTAGELLAIPAAAPVPSVPSIIVTMNKIGTE